MISIMGWRWVSNVKSVVSSRYFFVETKKNRRRENGMTKHKVNEKCGELSTSRRIYARIYRAVLFTMD